MKSSFKGNLNLLVKYLKPLRFQVLSLALLMGGTIILQLINPQIVRYFLDSAARGEDTRKLTLAAGLFMLFALFQQVIAVGTTWVSQNIGWSATNRLRLDLIGHCLHLDMDFHNSHRSGELIERVDGDINNLFNFFSNLSISVLNNIILILGILLMLLREDWRIALGMGIFVIVSALVMNWMQGKGVPHWRKEREYVADFYGFLGEQIGSTEDIRTTGASRYTMKRYHNFLREWWPFHERSSMAGYSMWIIMNAIFAAGTIIAFGIGGSLKLRGVITVGTVYLIYNYTQQLRGPIQQMRNQFQQLQTARASISRIDELFMKSSSIVDGNEDLQKSGAFKVDIKGVSFGYEDEASVLKNIDLSLGEGRILGVLGRTGSGKTTLARLIIRLYDPDMGDIRYNDKSLKSISIKSLRERVTYVTQEVQLFQGTLRDNLTFFNPGIPDEKILKALEEVGLLEWVKSQPGGLDTEISSGGGGLSSGEAQLFAFARVFLKDPGLIILDEASSRLDPITEHRVELALGRLLQGRTCIIIAHRLRTIQRVDEIMILEDGRIIENGKREALAGDRKSRFYSLLQTGMEEVLV